MHGIEIVALEYNPAAEAAKDALIGIFSRLEKYKAYKPENAAYIRQREQEVAVLVDYLDAADRCIKVLMETHRQYAPSPTPKESEPHPRDLMGREAYRYTTISKAKSEWPELY